MKRIRDWVDAHTGRLTAVLASAVLALWGLAHYFPELDAWLRSSSFLAVLQLVVTLEVVRRLAGTESSTRQPKVEIYRDQQEATEPLLQLIRQTKPRRVDLIEYSAVTVEALLHELTAIGATVRLLIHDPETAETPWQRERIRGSRANLLDVVFRDYPHVEIREYQEPASLRGRRFDGQTVCASWYTYAADDIGVWGHINPVIIAPISTPEGSALSAMFDRTFSQLWDDPRTRRITSRGANAA